MLPAKPLSEIDMYFASVLLLLLVLPAISVVANTFLSSHAVPLIALVGKWWVFWAIGVRLFIAGIRQVAQPAFTAQAIFHVNDPGVIPIVREVGFGNLSMGLLGLSTFLRPAWLVPAAIVGGLYYALGGVGHLINADRNTKENIALFSDAFAALILLVFVAKSFA